MKKEKAFAWLLTGILTVSMLGGCGGTGHSEAASRTDAPGAETTAPEKTAGPVTIRFSWWGDKSRHDGTLAAVSLWNEKHPEIQVETYFSGWDDYHPKLETQFASSTAPDVFQYSIDKLRLYVSQGQVQDLSAYVDTAFSGIDASLWFSLTVDGKPYAVSSGAGSNALAYNKTKLEEFGIGLPTDEENWDDLLEKCKQATRDTDGDGKVDFWGIQSLIDSPLEMYYPFLRQNGVEMWTEDLKGSNFGRPETLEALKTFAAFDEAGVTVPTDVTLPEGMSFLTAGYSAFALIPLSGFVSAQDQTTDELGLVAYPVVKDGVEAREMTSGLPIGIYSKTEYQEECVAFLSWLLTDPEAARTSGMVRGIFPSTAQREATAESMSEPQQQVMRVANYTAALGIQKGYPSPLHMGEFTDIWTQEIGRYNYREVTLEGFLENITKSADPVLNQD